MKIYNKLVRDNIPEIIIKNGNTPTTRILSDTEYEAELLKKLLEECNEVIDADSNQNRLAELADTLEVLISIARLQGNTLQDVITTAEIKKTKRGGFEKKIFLENVLDED